ncbi:general odorant-binding protein 19d-like [Chironomus tepperi]|uniref:general odorant-binding protein 19d-like n=1 Tax=Chironomus tepperi TaxID=113505 RepID=UPI00391F62BC
MKLLLSLILIATVVLHSQAKTREEMKAKWHELAKECQKTTGASDDELEKILSHAKPETHEGKCMISCAFETMGVVKDGKINKDGLEAWQKESPIPDDVIQMAITDCEDVTDDDHCEAAAKIGHCFKDTLKKAGLFPDD